MLRSSLNSRTTMLRRAHSSKSRRTCSSLVVAFAFVGIFLLGKLWPWGKLASFLRFWSQFSFLLGSFYILFILNDTYAYYIILMLKSEVLV